MIGLLAGLGLPYLKSYGRTLCRISGSDRLSEKKRPNYRLSDLDPAMWRLNYYALLSTVAWECHQGNPNMG